MTMRENLFTATLYATAPLLVWTLHFVLCYLVLGGRCGAAPLVLSALALAACVWMMDWKRPQGLLAWARSGSAVLALAGIAWTTMPLLLLGRCG